MTTEPVILTPESHPHTRVTVAWAKFQENLKAAAIEQVGIRERRARNITDDTEYHRAAEAEGVT